MSLPDRGSCSLCGSIRPTSHPPHLYSHLPGFMMSIVELDDKERITIPKRMRVVFKGKKALLIDVATG